MLVVRNAWTMPQERYNTQWVQDRGVGIVHDSFRTIGAAVAEMVANIDALQARVRRFHNRAVFEVPEVLADILHASAPQRGTTCLVAHGVSVSSAAALASS